MESKAYFTVSELAAKIGITRDAIHKRIRRGEIKVEKYGNRYLIPVGEFEFLLTRELTDKIKVEIDKGVERVVKEYGETLKRLGKE